MRLCRVRLSGVGPFAFADIPFADDDGEPRPVVVVHGGGGVGKTTLLASIACTRPGNATVLQGPAFARSTGPEAPCASCEYHLGLDDPERPHPLRVTTPSTERREGDDESEILRRREQALFDRRAREGGYVFVAFPATRWFSRQPLALSAPLRSVARYDVRAPSGHDDGSRADLARETKQALAYADIARALAAGGADHGRGLERLGTAMREAVGVMTQLYGFSYTGLDATSFEPVFETADGRPRPFDDLPTRVRHLVAFAALTVRALWAAYPGRDPRLTEGIATIDEVELHQDVAILPDLCAALERAVPGVQWVVTTSSAVVAASRESRDVVALRRTGDESVELCVGRAAITH